MESSMRHLFAQYFRRIGYWDEMFLVIPAPGNSRGASVEVRNENRIDLHLDHQATDLLERVKCASGPRQPAICMTHCASSIMIKS